MNIPLSRVAVRALLGAPQPLRRRAEQFIDELTTDPFQEPDFTELSPSGRTFTVHVQGDLVLTLWVDHSEKEVRFVHVGTPRPRKPCPVARRRESVCWTASPSKRVGRSATPKTTLGIPPPTFHFRGNAARRASRHCRNYATTVFLPSVV